MIEPVKKAHILLSRKSEIDYWKAEGFTTRTAAHMALEQLEKSGLEALVLSIEISKKARE